MTDQPQTLCRTCASPIGYVDCPTGGWWAHETHPADEHDAVPGAWVDGDDLMETIAAEVWEHCASEGTSLVVDDPRNIAGTAAAVARRMLAPAVPAVPVSSPPPDQTAEPVCKFDEGCHRVAPCDPGCGTPPPDQALRDRIAMTLARTKLRPPYLHCLVMADAVLAVLPPPAARTAVLNAAAQHLYTALFPAVYDDLGQKAAEGVNRAVSELRRLAAEAQQPDTETRP